MKRCLNPAAPLLQRRWAAPRQYQSMPSCGLIPAAHIPGQVKPPCAAHEEAEGARAQPVEARSEALVVGALGLRAIDGHVAVAHNPLHIVQVLLG